MCEGVRRRQEILGTAISRRYGGRWGEVGGVGGGVGGRRVGSCPILEWPKNKEEFHLSRTRKKRWMY